MIDEFDWLLILAEVMGAVGGIVIGALYIWVHKDM